MIDDKLLDLSKKIQTICPIGYSISTAESCTGGLLAAIITASPGSSRYFHQGIVCYSNDSKNKLIGVSLATLNNFGSVSKEVAKEMAIGSRRVASSDFAISITGIAGPEGGSKEKPVGTVYLGIATNTFIKTHKFCFYGNRSEIRNQSCTKGLEIILEHITLNV